MELKGERKGLRGRMKERQTETKGRNIDFCRKNIYIFYFFLICNICHCLFNSMNLFCAVSVTKLC